MIKIWIASDHAGLDLKSFLLKSDLDKEISEEGSPRGIAWIDKGPNNSESVDYPDFTDLVCQNVIAESAKELISPLLRVAGILICGSGQGMAMRANKYLPIRAALCWNTEITKLSREHNNANVLCLGARFVTPQEALSITSVFLTTAFAGDRHQRRVDKVSRPTTTLGKNS